MIESDKKHIMTKADVCLISAIFAVTLMLLLIFRLTRAGGSYANVSYDGMVMMQLPLSRPEAKCYLLTERISPSSEGEPPAYDIEELSEEEWLNMQHSTGDYNVILCQDGKVRMLESSCPDQICVHHSAIHFTGENIICLPHKIVIEIVNDEELGLDGMAY